MNEKQPLFTTDEIELFDATIDFLEAVCRQRKGAPQDSAIPRNVYNVLLLNLAKVASDTRAILLLVQAGFYIQAGILARSTTDACNLVMHIDVERDSADLVERWMEGKKITHWMLVESLEDVPLDKNRYRELRRRLDDFVHANYEALKLYPAQLTGEASADAGTFQAMTFWKGLIYFYLITCLLSIQLIAPYLEEQADSYLDRLVTLI
jgi:hypothetical protein